MSNVQHMNVNVEGRGEQTMSLCARMSAIMTVAALALLGLLFAATGDWSYVKLAGVLGFVALLPIVFNLVSPRRKGVCWLDNTECGDAR
jgi:hypothetical protein